MDAIRAHMAARASGALVPATAGMVGSIESSDPEMQRLYAQLQDVSARILRGDLGPELAAIEAEGEAAPIYNSAGMRLNTREVVARERQGKLRNDLIETLLKQCPTFRPPPDWKPPKRERKMYIPQKEYPGYNFFGLIIGPRGNTQKRLQRETNTRIAIRGRGSIKEGSSRDPKVDYAEWDELHVLITGDTDEDVAKAAELVQQLLRPVDDSANEHKRAQLRELALINGTLKEAEPCYLCGKQGHVQYDCPDKDITSYRAPKEMVTCKICGDGGHPTIDCPLGRNAKALGNAQPGGPGAATQMQEEYRSFLSEVGLDADAPGGPCGGPLPPPPPPPQGGGRRPSRAAGPGGARGTPCCWPPRPPAGSRAGLALLLRGAEPGVPGAVRAVRDGPAGGVHAAAAPSHGPPGRRRRRHGPVRWPWQRAAGPPQAVCRLPAPPLERRPPASLLWALR